MPSGRSDPRSPGTRRESPGRRRLCGTVRVHRGCERRLSTGRRAQCGPSSPERAARGGIGCPESAITGRTDPPISRVSGRVPRWYADHRRVCLPREHGTGPSGNFPNPRKTGIHGQYRRSDGRLRGGGLGPNQWSGTARYDERIALVRRFSAPNHALPVEYGRSKRGREPVSTVLARVSSDTGRVSAAPGRRSATRTICTGVDARCFSG